MRKNTGAIARAITEQSTGAEQVAKEALRAEKLVTGVARAMAEQSTGAAQITGAVEGMRLQAEQMAKATAEQNKAVGDMNTAANNVAKQSKLITRANREHSGVAEALLGQVAEVRRIADRNAAGVKETRGTTSRLRDQAKALTSIVEGRVTSAERRTSGNGAR